MKEPACTINDKPVVRFNSNGEVINDNSTETKTSTVTDNRVPETDPDTESTDTGV